MFQLLTSYHYMHSTVPSSTFLFVSSVAAGGQVLGAALARAPPGLWGAAALRSPFLDPSSALCPPQADESEASPATETADPAASRAPADPLIAHEAGEWGDGASAADAADIAAACPYALLGAALKHNSSGSENSSSSSSGSSMYQLQLPPVLVSVGSEDARVPCWGPAKWVARARALQAQAARRAGAAPPAAAWWGRAAPGLVALRVGWDEGHVPSGANGMVQAAAWEMAFVARALALRERVLQEL